MNISGSTVIITGAGGGIGRALAVAFGGEGANVVCCARRENKLHETVRLLEKAGGRGLVAPADITVPGQVARMVEKTLECYGEIDVLFNNAGSFASIAPLWEADHDTWWWDVKVNLYGAMLCIREVLPHMMQRNSGIIINMDGGRPVGGSAYAAGKAGLMEMCRVLCDELQSVGSEVVILGAGPGLVDTEMTRLQAETEAGRKWIPSTSEALQKGMTRSPEEIAEKTVEIVRIARAELSGAYYGPDTDIGDLIPGQGAAGGDSNA